MKNYYLKPFVALGLFLMMQIGFAQSALSESSNAGAIELYLNQKQLDYNFSDTDIQDLIVSSEFTGKNDVTHVYVTQRVQNIEVFNAISSFAIKHNFVFHFANNFISNTNEKINTTTPVLNAEQAILKTAAHFNLGSVGNLELIDTGNMSYLFSTGSISKSNIPVKLVFSKTEDGNLRLAWDLSIQAKDGKNWWSVRVDAVSGNLIDINNWIASCNFGDATNSHDHAKHSHTIESFNLFKQNSLFVDGSQYNVYALPIESPNHGGRTLVSEPAVASASPFGWHDTSGSVGAEYTTTRGNNVWAQEDRDANDDDMGFSPEGTAALNFDFALNINQAPASYEDVSITNLFYMNNMMHDVWYQYGFTEASGNFQENNYGNGGNGSDFVYADGQDGAGLNNASFGTPPDGNNPGMTMFLWAASGAPLPPLTLNNSILAGDYIAAFPSTALGTDGVGNITGPSTPVTADLVVVNDGSANPTEGCNPLINGGAINGKIAVIKRGNCPFTDKIQNAQNAGAVGVIVVNHNNPTNDPNYSEYVNMYGVTDPLFTIPSIFVNLTDGDAIIAALNSGTTINATIANNGPYERDGSFDNSIVAHEYGHGISNRLTGGRFNSGCLQNPEQMGEGWSDWFAIMLTIEPGDTGTDGRGIATYSSGQGIDGVGIRPEKYTTNFAENNYTYGATNDDTIIGTINGQPVAWNEIVHNIGFVWASMLWDLSWAYIDKYGYDPDLINGTGGNNKVMQLVMDGLMLQPCSPGFVSGRDALLAADTANGGVDQCLIWEVFANRGLGFGASQGSANNMEDQVEDFSMPPSTLPTLANCDNLSVEEFGADNYSIYPNPTSNEINIKVNGNYGDVSIAIYDINGRVVYTQDNAELNNIMTIDVSKLQTGVYVLGIAGDNFNVNEKIIIK